MTIDASNTEDRLARAMARCQCCADSMFRLTLTIECCCCGASLQSAGRTDMALGEDDAQEGI